MKKYKSIEKLQLSVLRKYLHVMQEHGTWDTMCSPLLLTMNIQTSTLMRSYNARMQNHKLLVPTIGILFIGNEEQSDSFNLRSHMMELFQ